MALVTKFDPKKNEDTVVKDYNAEIEVLKEDEGGEGSTIIKFVITSEAEDSDGDIIQTKGWDLRDYKKNPVVLWAHDKHVPPVARAEKITKEDGRVVSDAVFTPKEVSEFGYSVGQMYKHKFLNAVSVGFRPVEWSETENGFLFKKQKLLEYSAVPVPANPEALVIARSVGIDTAPYIKYIERLLDTYSKGNVFYGKKFLEQVHKAADPKAKISIYVKAPNGVEYLFKSTKDDEVLSPIEVKLHEVVFNGPISYHTAHDLTPQTDNEKEWDEGKEWEEADVKQLKTMASWVLPENHGHKEGYQFLHHFKDGTTSWAGVSECMEKLMGSEDSAHLSLEDKRSIYNHLKTHYSEFGIPVPEFKYIEAEVLLKFPDIFTFDAESGQVVQTLEAKHDLKEDDCLVIEDDDQGSEGQTKGDEEELTLEDIKDIVETNVYSEVGRLVNESLGKLD